MNGNWSTVKSKLNLFPDYQSAVFEQGYLITNRDIKMDDDFPYFGNWRKYQWNNLHFYLHQHQKLFVHEEAGRLYFLIGHAYDPFAVISEESQILKRYAAVSCGDFVKGLPCVYDMTGLFLMGFTDGEHVTFWGDFESMRTTYYGKIGSHWYISSHEELVAFQEPLTPDPYVDRLESYRFYHLYGEGLPSDISHYFELKKLICNNYVNYEDGCFKARRFFPRGPLKMCGSEEEYRQTVEKIAQIMRTSLEMTVKKWPRAAVSVTGGRDSKGSLAASVHIKDQLQYFSYNSQPAEKLDCDAAHAICKALNIDHTTYHIPLDKDTYPEYDLVEALLCVNSNRRWFNHNDIMKRIYFRKLHPFDVEVKSWTSEIGRAFYYVRYGVKHMQKKATGRRVNVMNNIYLLAPRLMYQTDKRYRDYLLHSEFNEHMFNYDWSDIIDLEMRDSRWGADVLCCEHMFSYDVTVPYNNRHLGDLLLSPPLEKRLASQTHIDFTNLLCPEIEATNIAVRDAGHNKKRMWMDKIYYFVSCLRPF